METPNGPTRSWWSKPEGKVGAWALGILAVLVVAGVAFNLQALTAALAAIAANTLHLMLSLVGIAAIAMIGIHPTSRNAIKLAYKMFWKGVTGFFITLDPIAILNDYVEQLRGNLKLMSTQIGAVRGTLAKLSEQIAVYTKEINAMIAEAKVAEEKMKSPGNERFKTLVIKNKRKASMRQNAVKELKVVYQKIEMILRVLVKMHENCDVMVDIKADEVQLNKAKWEGIRNANSAMKSAMSIISGGGDERANFEMAMEHMADEMAMQMGEMENFMEESQGFMDSIDLQNATYDAKSLESLENWEKNIDSLILGEDKDDIIGATYDEQNDVNDMNIKLFN